MSGARGRRIRKRPADPAASVPDPSAHRVPRTAPLDPEADAVPRCQRCGHEVAAKPEGCKNPCPNCGFLYPLGDCSD